VPRKYRKTGSSAPKPRTGRATGKVVSQAKSVSEASFAALVRGMAGKPSRPVSRITLQAAPLAHLPYKDELDLKDRALAEFWKSNKLTGSPAPVVPSPRPRKYRTTSKRRTILRGPYLYLVFGDKLLQAQKKSFMESPWNRLSMPGSIPFCSRNLANPPSSSWLPT